jgi:hypothetical protein
VVAVQRIGRLDVALPRPAGLMAGAVRLGILSLFVVLVAMIRVRITASSAGWVVLAGALGYTAVSTAFVSPPGDILANSRGARAATVIEMLTAFALVTACASSFVDWHRPSAPEDHR